MVIRLAQRDHLEATSLDRFAKSAATWLRSARPNRCQAMSDHELETLVRSDAEEARTFRICDDRDVKRYINLKLFLGPEFPQGPDFPWALPILKIESLSASHRLDLLWHQVNSG